MVLKKPEFVGGKISLAGKRPDQRASIFLFACKSEDLDCSGRESLVHEGALIDSACRTWRLTCRIWK